MTKTPRARYPQELKQQAVAMAVEDGFVRDEFRAENFLAMGNWGT